MADATQTERAETPEPSGDDADPPDPTAKPTGPNDPDVADEALAKIVDIDERIKIRRTEVLQVRAVTECLDKFSPGLVLTMDTGGTQVVDQRDTVDVDIVSARNLAILNGFKALAAVFGRWATKDPIGGTL